jgi:glucokinase
MSAPVSQAPARNVPAIDVGGTHVTAALADTARRRTVEGTRHRTPLRSGATAAEIIATLANSVRPLGDIRLSPLGVAMPGPFDYETGIGRFHDVGKFEPLNGIDVGAALLAALPAPPARIVFVNDASAFTIGEWISGAARGARRVVGITLGTGVGSAFLDDGRVVSEGPEVPPNGYAHLLRINGQPLEDVVSRRAIIGAYGSAQAGAGNQLVASQAAATPRPTVDVDVIARLAASGDGIAQAVVRHAVGALGQALRPWLVRFDADILVVGGGIAGSWELVEPPLKRALLHSGTSAPAWRGGAIAQSRNPEDSALLGAALHAVAGGQEPKPGKSGRSPKGR